MSGRQEADSQRYVPLRQEEVDSLLSGDVRKIAGDKKAVVLLLHRMGATLREVNQRLASLSMELERSRQAQADGAHPMQRALAALAALDDGQRREILDRNYLSAMDALEKERALTELARTAAQSSHNRVRMLLGSLLEEELPSSARGRIESMLRDLGGSHSS